MAKNPKLNQIIAIEDGAKKQEYADLTKAHHILQKAQLFNGFSRTYKPRQEDGVQYPPDGNKVQVNAKQLVAQVKEQLGELFNIISAKDHGNAEAKADVVIEGEDKPLLTGIPVTHILYLEKKLVDLRTFIRKLPRLDPAKDWRYDANSGMWKTAEEQQIKTRKVTKPLVMYEPTKEHPAQTQPVTVDEPEGTWSRIDMSTAYPQDEIVAMEKRLTQVEKALKTAREEGNSLEVQKKKTGDVVLSYILG
jgi:hypothetical protein